jgi:hypothetical protein
MNIVEIKWSMRVLRPKAGRKFVIITKSVQGAA